MNRLLLLLLLACASSAHAAIQTLTACTVSEDGSGTGTMGDRSATICCELTSAPLEEHRFRVNMGLSEGSPGTDSNAAYASAGWWRVSSNATVTAQDGEATRCLKLTNLVPATTHYVSIETSDTDGTTWSAELTPAVNCTACDSGDNALFGDAGSGHSNFDSVSGENLRFTTAAEDSPLPASPIAPTHNISAVSPAADNTHDPGVTCADIATARSSAEATAESGGTVERIEIGAGVTCPAAFTFPNLTQGRIQYAATNVGTNLLPPPGTRITPEFLPYMGRLSYDPDDPSTWQDLGGAGVVQAATNGNNHDFIGLFIGPPDHTAVDKVSEAITDVTGDTITLGAMPFANGIAVLANFDGTGITSGHGPAKVCNISSLTMQLCASDGSTVKTLNGSWSAGGTIDLWPSQPITGHADCGDGEHCVTVTDHGIGEYAKLTITGNSSATTITFTGVPSEYDFGTTRAVLIQGSSDASCNGRWTYVSGSSGTMTLSGSGLDCDNATDGTVQVIDSVIVWSTDTDAIGTIANKKTWHVTPEDANTLRLWGSTADASVSGGYITWEAEQWGQWLRGAEGGGGNLRFDRVIVGCRFPWRCTFTTNFGLDTEIVYRAGEYYRTMWNRVDPISGDQQTPIQTANGPMQIIPQDQILDLQVLNNLIWDGTVTGSGGSSVNDAGISSEDITMAQNTNWWPDAHVQDHPAWDGIEHGDGNYMLEWKSGIRTKIVGNYFKGQRVAFANNAGFMALAGNLSHRDIDIGYNTFARGGNGVLFYYYLDVGCCGKPQPPTIRLRFHDNLITELSREYDQGSGSGQAIRINEAGEDIVIERNIISPANVSSAQGIIFQRPGQGMFVRKNTFVINEGSGTGFTGGFSSGNATYLYASGDVAALFAGLYNRANTPDSNSTLSDNILIPCIQGASTYTTLAAYYADLGSTTASINFTAAEAAALGTIDDANVNWTEIIDGTDCLTRLNSVFQPGTYTPQSGYEDYMPDPRTVSDQQGWTWDVQVSRSQTTATVTLEAPDTDGCSVDIAAVADGFFDAAGEITRKTDASASQTQTFNFTSLTANTAYYLRAMCKEILYSTFTTLTE